MKKFIMNYVCLFTGVLILSFFANNIEVHAQNVIESNSEESENLVKVDTQGTDVESEIYLDESLLDDAQIFINDTKYVVKKGKLVKDNSFSDINPFAEYVVNFTLKNGRTGSLQRDALSGTPINWSSYGPEELRLMKITNTRGTTLGQITGDDYGVGLTITAPYTGMYVFEVTNFSAFTQTWRCVVRF